MDVQKTADSSIKTANNYSAPALEKRLDILEMLCQSERGLTLKESLRGLDVA